MSARTPRIVHDRTRFPMVWSDAAQAFIGYFPVTKIQLEYFLCDRPGAAFDQRWYESLLKLNERIAPGRIQSDNFYKAFVTGISPVQAKQFAAWLGRESDETYTLLNQRQWYDVYEEFREYESPGIQSLLLPAQPPRVELLLQKIDSVCQKMKSPASLADAMLMQGGVFEWVEMDGDAWGGAGKPIAALNPGLISLSNRRPRQPGNTESATAFFGFRVIKREI